MPSIDPTALERALARIRPETIDAHLRFLAHPLLEGRAPGTRGGTLAMEYIRAQLQRIGLRGPGGSYLQEVPMVGLTPRPSLAFQTPQGPVEPRYEDEYVLEAGVPETAVEVDAPLVFAGFGIAAPEWTWDDFKDADVRGKVLLVRVNDPGTEANPDFFGGPALTYYGRWTYKFEEASRRGAAGVLLIHTDESAGYPWRVVRTSNTGQQFDLAGAPEFPLRVRGWIPESLARGLLERAGHEYESLLRQSETPGFRPLDTGIRVRAAVESTVEPVRTANVVGLLPGSDAARAEEPVILSSHYDHLGVRTAADGTRSIHPGAYDNASGVALLLTVAEAAASLPDAAPRPLLFVATTAEESGLLGAEWYARNPLFPLATTAAALNVDGANLQGRTRDLTPLGADRSTLGEAVREAAAEEGMVINPDPHPEQGMFYRQDHFPLARSGVPALALDHGLTFENRPEGWGQRWYDEFVTRHYHQPSDSFAEGWDYGGAVQQGRVMLRTALAAAAAPQIAAWLPGAGFARRQGS
jgi:Zn-dependent M28 family amino/carboxypeptidase